MHTYKSISIIFKYIRGMFIKLLTTLLPIHIVQFENNYLICGYMQRVRFTEPYLTFCRPWTTF